MSPYHSKVADLDVEPGSNFYVQDFSISEKRSAGLLVHRFDARMGAEGTAAQQALRVELEVDGLKAG